MGFGNNDANIIQAALPLANEERMKAGLRADAVDPMMLFRLVYQSQMMRSFPSMQ